MAQFYPIPGGAVPGGADLKRDIADLGNGDGYAKRARTEAVSSPGAGGADGGASRVLHVRNVSPDTPQDELINFCSQFGPVVQVCVLQKFSQALVEMGDVNAAAAVIMYNRTNPVFIRGKEVKFSYSKSQSINASVAGKAAPSSKAPAGGSHILLNTILNPVYNITVDVLYAIMSPYGAVQRIVIFKKHGVQALVEFDSIASAINAKAALEGKDIYAGSCTLKIEFSKAEKLNVHINNDMTRDYTGAGSSSGSGGGLAAPGLAPPQYASNPYASGGGGLIPGLGAGGYPYQGGDLSSLGLDPSTLGLLGGSMGGPSGVMNMLGNPTLAGLGGMPGLAPDTSRSVLIIYGISEVVTVDRLFNLFCLYGNVVKIKLIPNKKGSALVQMADNQSADIAMQLLNGSFMFGQALQIQHSKHPYIADSHTERSADPANEASPTTKDFSNSPLNRFTRPGANAFKHIVKPTNVIYFSNAPREYNEQNFLQMFIGMNTHAPTQVKFFQLAPPSGASAGSRIGLLEFADPIAATEALVIANNTKAGGHTIRLAFSNNSIHSNNPPPMQ